MPRVDVLVVTWNSADDIVDCLQAATDQRDVSLDLVVVDSGSADASPDLVAESFPSARLIRLADNVGYTAASNRGAEACDGDYLLLLNPDCHVEAGCVRALVEHLETTPKCGAAAAALTYPDGRPQCFARRELTVGSAWWCLTETGTRLDNRLFGGRHQQHRWYGPEMADGVDHVFSVDSPAAACVLLRRASLPAPLFDERLPLVYSDTDLYHRIRQAGQSVDVVPEARAVHGYGRSLRLVPARRMRAESVRSLLRYTDIWWSRPRQWALRLLLLLDCLGALAFAGLGKSREQALDAAAGTAGGLGLPGGARPWLTG